MKKNYKYKALFLFMMIIVLTFIPFQTFAAPKVSASSVTMKPGEQKEVNLILDNAANYKTLQNLSFKSSNTSVVTVSNVAAATGTATLKAIAPGSAQITVSYKRKVNNKYVQESKTIRVKVDSDIKFNKTCFCLQKNNTDQLTVTGTNIATSYSSRDTKIASVAKNGKITANGCGSTQIVVKVTWNEDSKTQNKTYEFPVNVSENIVTKNLIMNYNLSGYNNNVDIRPYLSKGISNYSIEMSNSGIGSLSGSIYTTTGTGTNKLTCVSKSETVEITIKQYAWTAHRGESDTYPENTIDAFRQAVLDGAFAIETDVRATADGRLIISHDGNLKAYNGTAYQIKNMTFDELRQVVITKGNGIENCKHPYFCTLEEMLEATTPYKVRECIEIKSLTCSIPLEETVKELVQIINRTGSKYNCFVLTQSAEIRDMIHKLDPDIVLCYKDENGDNHFLTEQRSLYNAVWGDSLSHEMSENAPAVGIQNQPLKNFRS